MDKKMLEKIDKALDRLNAVLPLKANQESCTPGIKRVHQEMLRSFVDQGKILSRDEMAARTENLDEAIEFGDRFFSPLMS